MNLLSWNISLLLKMCTQQKQWQELYLQSCSLTGRKQGACMWEVSSDCCSGLRPFLLSESLLFPKGKFVLGHAWIWNNINNMGRKDSIYTTLMWGQQQGQEQSQRRPGSSSSRKYRGGHRHIALFGAVSLCLPFSHLGNKKEG